MFAGFVQQMTVLDSELDLQSSVAVVYLLSIVIKKLVVDFFCSVCRLKVGLSFYL